ncbi:MAG: sulfurtransferase [Cyanobacteria bacterium]|nr:sulfurtransferase [Cyanobacteriota bacterium]
MHNLNQPTGPITNPHDSINLQSSIATAAVHPIVSADWLRLHLDDSSVVVVDCRFSLMEPAAGRKQYDISHIQGAHYLDLNQDLSKNLQAHGGRHPLPDVHTFSSKLQAMGIDDDTWVVLYDSARLSYAARAWWLLRYLGHDRTLLLNGGWQAWTGMHYPITKELPPEKLGNFIPVVQSDWTVDINYVKASMNAPGSVLIDSRETVRYRGDREPIDPIAGHISGAINYPWQQVTDERGYINAELQADRWASLKDSLEHNDKTEIIVYCGSGVTACVNLLSLSLSGHHAKLYVGGWSDWCSYL